VSERNLPSHVVKSGDDDMKTTNVVRMYCGASCIYFDDGSCEPDIEWYVPQYAEKATCSLCRREVGIIDL